MNDNDKYYIKAVRASNWRSWCGDSVEWIPGKILTDPDADPDPNTKCGNGLHCSKELLQAVQYQIGPSGYLYVDPIEIIARDVDKIRCRSIRVVRALTKEEIDDIAGFALWEINHPTNPLLLDTEPFSHIYVSFLSQWNSVWASVGDSVWDFVWDSVRNSVRNSVWASVGDSVWDFVWDSVSNSVRNSAGDFVWESVRASVGAYIVNLFPGISNWKYVETLGSDPCKALAKLWYAGYVPSFDGHTWRLHAGPKARIVWEGKL